MQIRYLTEFDKIKLLSNLLILGEQITQIMYYSMQFVFMGDFWIIPKSFHMCVCPLKLSRHRPEKRTSGSQSLYPILRVLQIVLSFPAFRYAPSLKVSTNSLKWNFILLQLAPMRRKSKLKDYSYFPFMARSIFYPSCTTQKFPGIKLRSVFDYPMNPLFAFF